MSNIVKVKLCKNKYNPTSNQDEPGETIDDIGYHCILCPSTDYCLVTPAYPRTVTNLWALYL
ncbi:unnamed protein product [marine sediment metagenome]|uniref:Uncharacterized protein n=1 Tax=marine sediment metagenome TaxID=412755 RepID=X1V782_9ZZZZ